MYLLFLRLAPLCILIPLPRVDSFHAVAKISTIIPLFSSHLHGNQRSAPLSLFLLFLLPFIRECMYIYHVCYTYICSLRFKFCYVLRATCLSFVVLFYGYVNLKNLLILMFRLKLILGIN